MPDPLPLRRVGHLEQDMGADPALEGRIHVGGEIGGEDDDAGEGLELVQEHVDHRVGLAVDGRLHRGEPPPGDGVGLVEEEHGVLPLGGAEHRRPRAWPSVPPSATPAPRSGPRAASDGACRPAPRRRWSCRCRAGRRSGTPARGPSSAAREPPLAEDEVVLAHQRQSMVQRAERPLRQHYIVERALGVDRLDELPGGSAEEEIANGVGHGER